MGGSLSALLTVKVSKALADMQALTAQVATFRVLSQGSSVVSRREVFVWLFKGDAQAIVIPVHLAKDRLTHSHGLSPFRISGS